MKNILVKYSIIALLFFVFSLIQAAFLPFFSIMGQFPNLVFILFYLILFFDENEESFFWAVMAGFLLDISLPSFFGISIISLLILYLFKKVLHYFVKDIQGKYFIVYFIVLFSVNFLIYNCLIYIASLIFGFQFTVSLALIVALIYNIAFLLPGFYIYTFLAKPDYLDNQLKLI